MSENLSIQISKAAKPKPKPDENTLVFGASFTDHMFVMDWDVGKGWHDARVEPYAPFLVEPAMATLHYAQAVFEGLKAYRHQDGSVYLFRPEKNIQRLNSSCQRICMPTVDEAFMQKALHELIRVEKAWVPSKEGTSLYVRPFMVAMEPFLGVRPARSYRLMVILCPVGAYYSSGFAPVKIKVADDYVRAAIGGTGNTKAAGNYAASLLAAEKAHEDGFTQVLWLDAAERKYVEEVGTMNIMFVINGEVVTPALSGSILPGVTRDTVLSLTRSWGIPTKERPIGIDEVIKAGETGALSEAFGTGTACVISSVGEMHYRDKVWKSGDGKVGPLSQRLFDEILGIQYGRKPDSFGWVDKIEA